MIYVALRVGGGKKELEYSLPISADDLMSARAAFKTWMKGRKFSPLDGAWGVQVEHGFIRPNLPWYSKLKDFDRIIALHAIADKHCRVLES